MAIAGQSRPQIKKTLPPPPSTQWKCILQSEMGTLAGKLNDGMEQLSTPTASPTLSRASSSRSARAWSPARWPRRTGPRSTVGPRTHSGPSAHVGPRSTTHYIARSWWGAGARLIDSRTQALTVTMRAGDGRRRRRLQRADEASAAGGKTMCGPRKYCPWKTTAGKRHGGRGAELRRRA